jgi:hypothetical protein
MDVEPTQRTVKIELLLYSSMANVLRIKPAAGCKFYKIKIVVL